MGYYPNMNQPQNNNGNQQPGMGYGAPQAPNPYGYNPGWPQQQAAYPYNTPAPLISPAYPVNAYQGSLVQAVARPWLGALLIFPLQALKAYLWPTPAMFALEKDRAGRFAIFCLLVIGGFLTGALVYFMGRLPHLVVGIEVLSAGRVQLQPLSIGVCVFIAISMQLLFLGLEWLLHWIAKKQGGTGSLRAQIYTGLLIEAPLFAVVVGIALVLLARPEIGGSLRLIFAVVGGGLLLYGFLLHICAVMAVQNLSVGKAAVCMALVGFTVLVVALLVMALGENITDGHGGGGNSHADGNGGKRGNGRQRMRTCPGCGYRQPFVLQNGQMDLLCSRCGNAMI